MAGFETTRWSLVLAAREEGPDARAALEALCRAYRPAVLAYVRGWGYSRSDAEDVTQGFFARLVEKRVHAAADPLRGRFRVFLRTALHNFMVSARESANAGRRKPAQGTAAIEVDDLPTHADDDLPERAFERAFALVVVHRAMRRLKREADAAGKRELFDRLQGFLLEAPERDDYERLAGESGTRPNTIAVATHRLRQRLRELVREELAETVDDPAAVDGEYEVVVGAMREGGPGPRAR
jgi:RNA polymerase sigma-70 factor (ECF subfamily)